MRNAKWESACALRGSGVTCCGILRRDSSKERSMTVSVVQAQDVVWRVDEVAAPVAFTLETSVLPYFPC
jgi:hypothetical protein